MYKSGCGVVGRGGDSLSSLFKSEWVSHSRLITSGWDVYHKDPNTPPWRMIAVNPAYLWMETFSWYTCGHTCSIVLIGSNYLVGWNDCTKSKLMKKFTSWNYGTHKCILWHDLVRQNIVHITGRMWKCQKNQPDNIQKIWSTLNNLMKW